MFEEILTNPRFRYIGNRRVVGDVWELSRRGDPSWSLIMAAGELGSYYHYVLSLETELVESLGRQGTRELLEDLCIRLGVDVARTHIELRRLRASTGRVVRSADRDGVVPVFRPDMGTEMEGRRMGRIGARRAAPAEWRCQCLR